MCELIGHLPKPLTGITSLAIGADQLFAEIIAQHGGSVEVVIPFDDYEERFKEAGKSQYWRLLHAASKIEVLQREGSDEEAYLAAGRRIVDLCDILIAVWDGKPASGLGGTADVVRYASQTRTSLIHLNPVSRLVLNLD
ncbi:MAG TPA: hypothetical protein VJT74_00325 [Pyrinomonadaceae bacterium]|nr:hypothetical protein [Pyrinomonadaceae bacterium]